jgi:hypothetical protein
MNAPAKQYWFMTRCLTGTVVVTLREVRQLHSKADDSRWTAFVAYVI